MEKNDNSAEVVKLSVRLGGYLELNFQTAAGTACPPDGEQSCLNIRLPRNEISALLDKNARCTVEFSDHVLHMCVVKRVRADKDWIFLTCRIDKTFRSSGAGLTAEAFCRP
jgi:hypothetical protein